MLNGQLREVLKYGQEHGFCHFSEMTSRESGAAVWANKDKPGKRARWHDSMRRNQASRQPPHRHNQQPAAAQRPISGPPLQLHAQASRQPQKRPIPDPSPPLRPTQPRALAPPPPTKYNLNARPAHSILRRQPRESKSAAPPPPKSARVQFTMDFNTTCRVIPPSQPSSDSEPIEVWAQGNFNEDAEGFVLDLEPCYTCTGPSCACPVQGPPRGVEPKDAKGLKAKNAQQERRNINSHVFTLDTAGYGPCPNTLECDMAGKTMCDARSMTRCKNCRLCHKCCGGHEGRREALCMNTPAGGGQGEMTDYGVDAFSKAQVNKASVNGKTLIDDLVGRAMGERVHPRLSGVKLLDYNPDLEKCKCLPGECPPPGGVCEGEIGNSKLTDDKALFR